MMTTVQCSICSQLNNKPRVVVTDFRLHRTCSIIIWLHSLSGVIRSLLCNPRAFSPGIIIISVCLKEAFLVKIANSNVCMDSVMDSVGICILGLRSS